ncbi:MAG: hypothetical protein FJ387_02505 [Verrucomicrobia bacterium]|nr:hypothetical protein [Verrucomicrobiota bacterium]
MSSQDTMAIPSALPAPASPQLSLFREPRESPNVAYLERMLHEARGWLTAAQLADRVGGMWDERKIRSMAHAASPDVISGQRGYRHIAHATAEEIQHAAAWLESQAGEMLARAQQIRRRGHQMVG